MNSLILRLRGPLQSWGTASSFDDRDTGLEPSRSGVVGLLCAALGFPRDNTFFEGLEFEAIANLQMAVRIDRPGSVISDYQTAGGGSWNGQRYGVATANKGLKTALSTRYALSDADFRVAVQSTDKALLNRLDRAVTDPVWTLSLGRKAFIPGMPITLGIRTQGMIEAIQQEPWDSLNERDTPPESLRVVYDDLAGSQRRRDVPVGRFADRRFAFRTVSSMFVPVPMTKDSTCTSPD